MLFEDNDGNIVTSDEMDNLFPWEINDRRLHIYDGNISVISCKGRHFHYGKNQYV